MGVTIIGIGNPDRGDDAAGRLVAARLKDRVPGGVIVIELDGEMAALVDRLESSDRAILIDAALSGGEPGTIHRFDAANEPMPAHLNGFSTHGFGLAQAIELARTLGTLPARCTVFAIEAQSFDHGAPLSPAVTAAVEAVAARVLAEASG